MTHPRDPNDGLVSVVATTSNQQLRRHITALAESADARVHFTDDTHHVLTPKAPLHVIGLDALNSPLSLTGTVILLLLDGEHPPPALPAEVHHVFRSPIDDARILRHVSHSVHTVNKRALTIAVHGATGGAGTTIFAAFLAGMCGFQSVPTTIMDASPTSTGIDLVFGIEAERGPRWPDLLDASGELRDIPRPAALQAALPRWRSISVLSMRSGPTQPQRRAVTETLGSLATSSGVVIVDGGHLPSPGEKITADFTVVVTPRQVRAVVAAHCFVRHFGNDDSMVLVTREVKNATVSAADVKRAVHVPVVGEVPLVKNLDARLDRGDGPPGPKARVWREMDRIFNHLRHAAPAAITVKRDRNAA